MGNLFLGRTLLSMAERPAPKLLETELEPSERGVWAAWAKGRGEQQATAAQTPAPGTAPKLVPAAQPR